jgi:hypothetical protein
VPCFKSATHLSLFSEGEALAGLPALPRIKYPSEAIDTTYSEVTSTRGAGGVGVHFLLMHFIVKAVVVGAMVNLLVIVWMLW